MKKIYALILAVVMIISLFGCANGNDPVETTDNTVTTEATLGDHEHDHGNETIGATEGTENTTEATEDTTTPSETETIPDSPDDIGNGGVEDDPSKSMPEPTQPAPTKPAETKHEHSYTSKVTKPTCESKGYTTYTCSCGNSYTADETKATGHNYNTETVAPTTESKGYDIHTCSKCGKSYKNNYTDKLPAPTEHKHEWVWSDYVGPNACREGYNVYTCACGETKTEGTGDVLECRWEAIEVVPPTTEEMGYTVYKCAVCGNTWTDYDREKLPAPTEPAPTEPAPTEPAECTNHEASSEVLASVTVSNTWYNAKCHCAYDILYTADTRDAAIALVQAHIAEHGGENETHYLSRVVGYEQYDHPTFFDCIHCGKKCTYSDYYEWKKCISDEIFG